MALLAWGYTELQMLVNTALIQVYTVVHPCEALILVLAHFTVQSWQCQDR